MQLGVMAAVTATLLLPSWSGSVAAARVAFAGPSVNCAAVTVMVHPGLHPPSGSVSPGTGRAPDAPRGSFPVSLPVYPGATPLKTFVASPYADYPESPYLQTAGIEFDVTPTPPDIETWTTSTFHACGWVSRGYWSGGSTQFTHGLFFEKENNANLSVEVSFGDAPAGGVYIAYGVEEVILPTRPARSYLHGPFVELKLAVQHNTQKYPSHSAVVHIDVRDRSAIRHLVSAINSITAYQTVIGMCHGGVGPPPPLAPVWLSFIRPNGTAVHAFADGSGGACGGGFAVNGARWLIFGVTAWNEVLVLAVGGRG